MNCESCGGRIVGGARAHCDCLRALVERVSQLEAARPAEPFAQQVAAMREQLTAAGFTDLNVEQALSDAITTVEGLRGDNAALTRAEDHKHELLMETCDQRDQAMKREREACDERDQARAGAAAMRRLLTDLQDWANPSELMVSKVHLEAVIAAIPEALKPDAGKGLAEAQKKLDSIWAILAKDGRPPIVEAVEALVNERNACLAEAKEAKGKVSEVETCYRESMEREENLRSKLDAVRDALEEP